MAFTLNFAVIVDVLHLLYESGRQIEYFTRRTLFSGQGKKYKEQIPLFEADNTNPTMLNKKVNLSLKFNKSLNNLNMPEQGPYTPVEQTLKTPLEHPWGPGGQPGNFHGYSANGASTPLAQETPSITAPPPLSRLGSVYTNPQYNESDDFLMLSNNASDSKTTRNFTLNFAPDFDNLVWSIYSHFLSLPTTTPFLGLIPPSGLVSKVANETMASLLKTTLNDAPSPLYDYQHIITSDSLSNHNYQAIFLQLIRKRFLDLCNFHVETSQVKDAQQQPLTKLPESTTVSITSNANGSVSINSYSGSNLRQSSISNLSLTELNISNYNANNGGASGQVSANRSRNSSMSLRKQSLTRNNSYLSNNWIHVGNINSIRPNHPHSNENFNASTDSLQSMPDYVPQSFINRSAAGVQTGANSFNAMLTDYQTPPASNKSSFSSHGLQPPIAFGSGGSAQNSTPPSSANTQTPLGFMSQGYEDFPCDSSDRSRSSSIKSNTFPRPLTINTEKANTQAMNALHGILMTPNGVRSGYEEFSLDSPFLSATTPNDDYGYLCNGFAGLNGGGISATSSTGASPVNTNAANNDTLMMDSKVHLPTAVSLSEKKRDSLKMKRGIH